MSDDDLTLALELADAADAITGRRFGARDLRVQAKQDRTPVSDADRDVEAAVREGLRAERPSDAVHGEEFADTGEGRRRWVIDPIDGTKNFVRGVPVWASLIALLDGEDAVVGVVSAPGLNRRWWAASGQGSWTRWGTSAPQRCRVSGVATLAEASLSYSSLDGWERRGRLDNLLELTRRCARTRAYGDFWSYMLLAEGGVDIATEPEVALHDLAAPAVVVAEAGGRFTDLGGTAGPGGGSAVATNAHLHETVLAQLGGGPGQARAR